MLDLELPRVTFLSLVPVQAGRELRQVAAGEIFSTTGLLGGLVRGDWADRREMATRTDSQTQKHHHEGWDIWHKRSGEN